MRKIILASTSPRRKEILASTGLVFEVMPSSYEEDNSLAMPPNQLVAHLAEGKARWVAEKYSDAIVIGADTLGTLDGRIIGKPRDKDDLISTFTALSGRSHSIFSGIAIVERDKVVTESVETKVFFRELTSQEIEKYAAHTQEWQDKAAGYGIQSLAGMFIERIEGDYYNVVGLPLCRLAVRLKEFRVDLLAK